MKNRSLHKVSFVPLALEDQKLVKRYSKELGYRSVLDNEKRINVIIDNMNTTYLIVKKGKTISCYRKGVFVPITENKISEIEVFKKRFRHLNVHQNIISAIFGLALFSSKIFSI